MSLNAPWLGNKLFDCIVLAAYYKWLALHPFIPSREMAEGAVESILIELRRDVSDVQKKQLVDRLLVLVRTKKEQLCMRPIRKDTAVRGSSTTTPT